MTLAPLLLYNFINKNNINIIINCAAYTAVDQAETNESLANKTNHLAVEYLARISKSKNIKLVHISTDYVFDGKNYKPYNEEDSVNPQGIYGITKQKGEQIMLDINPENSLIIRTSWVYSYYGKNFLKTILKLGKEKDELGIIYDQIGTPTYARDLAKMILEIIPKIQNKKVEIYNYTNEGVSSWYDFAKEIIKIAKLNCKICPLETYQYPTPACRPNYSILNKTKIKSDFEVNIPYWKDSLDECLQQLEVEKQ